MNLPSKDIATYLQGISSLGLLIKTDLFIGIEPSKPDNCTTIFDLAGDSPDLTMDGSGEYYRPAIQIRVRNDDYQNAYTIINNIKEQLHGLGPVIINGTRYMLIQCLIEPGFLSQDENDRFSFVTTFNIHRK